MPDEIPGDDENSTRWLIIGFVVVLFLGLGVAGWHYRATGKPAPICSSAEARCGDRQDGPGQ